MLDRIVITKMLWNIYSYKGNTKYMYLQKLGLKTPYQFQQASTNLLISWVQEKDKA